MDTLAYLILSFPFTGTVLGAVLLTGLLFILTMIYIKIWIIVHFFLWAMEGFFGSKNRTRA
jgi:hypothetical protein